MIMVTEVVAGLNPTFLALQRISPIEQCRMSKLVWTLNLWNSSSIWLLWTSMAFRRWNIRPQFTIAWLDSPWGSEAPTVSYSLDLSSSSSSLVRVFWLDVVALPLKLKYFLEVGLRSSPIDVSTSDFCKALMSKGSPRIPVISMLQGSNIPKWTTKAIIKRPKPIYIFGLWMTVKKLENTK